MALNALILTLACSRNESIMSRSTRDGLDGRRGIVMLLALESFLPGFCLANSASVYNRDTLVNHGCVNSLKFTILFNIFMYDIYV